MSEQDCQEGMNTAMNFLHIISCHARSCRQQRDIIKENIILLLTWEVMAGIWHYVSHRVSHGTE